MSENRILYTEDNHDFFQLITAILPDYEIVWATTIAAAVRQLVNGQFSLFLIDYNLPDGNGFELAQIIRSDVRETPIIFVTSDSTISESEALKAGGQSLLFKGSNTFIDDVAQTVIQNLEAAVLVN